MLRASRRLAPMFRRSLSAPSTFGRGQSSFNLNARPYSTDVDEYLPNMGKKQEESLVDEYLPNMGKKQEESLLGESAGGASAKVLTGTRQGATASASMIRTGFKGESGEFQMDKFRAKATPLGARVDPLYGAVSFNAGRFKGVLEGSPLGVSASPLGAAFGPVSPYIKATVGYQGESGQHAISTGWPIYNYTPNESGEPKVSESEAPVASEEAPLPVQKPTSPTSAEQQQGDDEVARIKALYESRSEFDPITR